MSLDRHGSEPASAARDASRAIQKFVIYLISNAHDATVTPPKATPNLIAWVLETGLGPWWNHHIGPSGAAADALKASELTARALTASRERALATLLDACAAKAIPVTLLKGVSVAAQYYPAPHLRTMGDIDVAVPPAALAEVEATLGQLGYRRESHLPDVFYARHHHAPPLLNPATGDWIELHTALLPPDAPMASRRPFRDREWEHESRPADWHGRAVLRLSPECQLIYTAAHWCQELRRVGGVFGLLDAVLLLRVEGARFDWDRVLDWSRDRLTRRQLGVFLGYLHDRLNVGLPTEVARALATHGPAEAMTRRAAWRLVDRFVLAGEPWGGVWSEATVAAVWKSLLGPGSAWRNLAALPVKLAFPPGHPERFSPGFQFRRLRRALSRGG